MKQVITVDNTMLNHVQEIDQKSTDDSIVKLFNFRRSKVLLVFSTVLFMLVLGNSTFCDDIEIHPSTYIPLFLDIDECAAQINPCDAVPNSECNNTDGSYNCQCKGGFVRNGPNCEGATQFLSLLWIFFILF